MAYNEPTSAVEVTIYCPVEGEIGGRDRGCVRSRGVPHTQTHIPPIYYTDAVDCFSRWGSTGCSVFGAT